MLPVDVRTNPVQTVAAHWDSVLHCPVRTGLQEMVRPGGEELLLVFSIFTVSPVSQTLNQQNLCVRTETPLSWRTRMKRTEEEESWR